jgi:hypothetical protein
MTSSSTTTSEHMDHLLLFILVLLTKDVGSNRRCIFPSIAFSGDIERPDAEAWESLIESPQSNIYIMGYLLLISRDVFDRRGNAEAGADRVIEEEETEDPVPWIWIWMKARIFAHTPRPQLVEVAD